MRAERGEEGKAVRGGRAAVGRMVGIGRVRDVRIAW